MWLPYLKRTFIIYPTLQDLPPSPQNLPNTLAIYTPLQNLPTPSEFTQPFRIYTPFKIYPHIQNLPTTFRIYPIGPG
jgi:hypothetical protein